MINCCGDLSDTSEREERFRPPGRKRILELEACENGTNLEPTHWRSLRFSGEKATFLSIRLYLEVPWPSRSGTLVSLYLPRYITSGWQLRLSWRGRLPLIVHSFACRAAVKVDHTWCGCEQVHPGPCRPAREAVEWQWQVCHASGWLLWVVYPRRHVSVSGCLDAHSTPSVMHASAHLHSRPGMLGQTVVRGVFPSPDAVGLLGFFFFFFSFVVDTLVCGINANAPSCMPTCSPYRCMCCPPSKHRPPTRARRPQKDPEFGPSVGLHRGRHHCLPCRCPGRPTWR
jgi:hypothetical protein